MAFFCVVSEVIESAGVRMESVGDDVGLTQRGRVFKGDVEGAAGVFCTSARGDEPCLQGVEAGVFTGPEPAFLASNAELGFVDEEAFMIGVRHGERAEVLVEIKSEFMRPTSDGIMRDGDIKQLHKDVSDLGRWDGMADGEVGDERDHRFREFHFVPIEGNGQVEAVEALDGIRGDPKSSAG